MLFFSDLVLWLLISFHFVGAATVFRRLFPDESPWLGYLIPPLLFVMVLNFIEHLVALPSLLWLLPVTLGGFCWSIFSPGYSWKGLRVPTFFFLFAFAFNFAIKCFHPEIPTNDAMADMNRILDFCFGEKLPPTDGWLPPFDHRWYYTYQHYAASVVKRLFNLDIGTAYNTTFTVLNALVCFTGTGIAYLASGYRAWVAFLIMLAIESGFTGSTPSLILTMKDVDFGYATDLNEGWRAHDPNPMFQLLKNSPHEALVLEDPGHWIWEDQFHANLSGFLMTFLAAFTTLEALGTRRGNWPWICLLAIPALTLVAATWYFLLTSILCLGALIVALSLRRKPENRAFVLIGTIIALGLLWPTLTAFTSWPHHQSLIWTPVDWRTPFWVFVFQWWPIYLPWLACFFLWRRMNAGMRWLHFSIFLLYMFVELFNVGDWRWDTIEKMWGAIFGLGLAVLLPPLIVSRNYFCRVVAIFVLFCSLLTLSVRLSRVERWVDWDAGFLRLQGDNYMRHDDYEPRMLQVLGQLHKSTILAGKCIWNYSPPPGLAVFTENRCYIAWFCSEQICGHGGEAEYRTAQNNAFYAGKMADPLGFLRANQIDAVMIWPDDNISDDLLARLRQQLASAYEYVDCGQKDGKKAGIFLIRPLPARAK